MTQPNPAALADLIQRLTEATGPDRELDTAICLYLHPWLAPLPRSDRGGWIDTARGRDTTIAPPPRYTESLDDSMELAGERTVDILLAALAMAAHYFVNFRDKDGHIKQALPRFVCIACLRAREQTP